MTFCKFPCGNAESACMEHCGKAAVEGDMETTAARSKDESEFVQVHFTACFGPFDVSKDRSWQPRQPFGSPVLQLSSCGFMRQQGQLSAPTKASSSKAELLFASGTSGKPIFAFQVLCHADRSVENGNHKMPTLRLKPRGAAPHIRRHCGL